MWVIETEAWLGELGRSPEEAIAVQHRKHGPDDPMCPSSPCTCVAVEVTERLAQYLRDFGTPRRWTTRGDGVRDIAFGA